MVFQNFASPIIRVYRKGDEKSYIALMRDVFPKYKCDLRRWRWEFVNAPLSSIQMFAEINGKIVGHMGLICLPIKIGNRIIKGSQAVDLAVHPSYRGRGIFLMIGQKLMEEAAKRNISLSYGIPNEPAYRGHLKYGWFLASYISVLVKLITKKGLVIFILSRILNFLRKPSFDSLSKLLCLVGNLKAIIRRKSNDTAMHFCAYEIVSIDFFDDKFDKFWKEIQDQHALVVVKNAKYLNWRYFNKPNTKYSVLAVIREGKVYGFVVLALDTYSILKRGYIIDLMAKSEDIIDYLVKSALKYFSAEYVDLVICWAMEGCSLYSCLIKKGFVQDYFNSQKLICRINTNDTTLKEYLHKFAKEWYFMMGDSDII